MYYRYNIHMYICKYIVFKCSVFAHPSLQVSRGLPATEAAKQGEDQACHPPCTVSR